MSECGHRQRLLPPFKRKDVSHTQRFERHVLRLLIGGNETEAARRPGVSAETVALVVRNQWADAKAKEVDPGRVVTDVGIDELSLKKRRRLYVTILTDLTDPERPEAPAVARGRDEAAGRRCLGKLSAGRRRRVRTYRADMGQALNNACRGLLPNARAVIDRFHVAKKFHEAVDGRRGKITGAYKAKRSRAERKEFRSWMWEFPRRPEELSPEDQDGPERLFGKLPALRTLYEIRVRFQRTFDTATDRRQAHRALIELFLDMLDDFPELAAFIHTLENGREEILNDFEARQTSGPVEGINNKARVIVQRAYGLKSAESRWTRLVLHLNRAGDVAPHTIEQMQGLVAGFRAIFSPSCT